MPIELQTIKFEGPYDVLAWKHPIEDFYTGSQLIVHESQEALFFGGGEALDLFGPGRHTLGTDNIPYVEKWYEKLFGIGKKLEAETPFHCEVYFVNKVTVMDILWCTPSTIQVMDLNNNSIVPAYARGQINIRIVESRQLLSEIVHTYKQVINENIQSYIRNLLMIPLTEMFSNIMIQQNIRIPFVEMVHYWKAGNHISDLSVFFHTQVATSLKGHGVEVVRFYINSVDVLEEHLADYMIRNGYIDETKQESSLQHNIHADISLWESNRLLGHRVDTNLLEVLEKFTPKS